MGAPDRLLTRRGLLAAGAGLIAATASPAFADPLTPDARKLLDAMPGKAVLGAQKTKPLVTELVDFNAPDWRRSAFDMRELLAGDAKLAYAIVQTPRVDVGSIEAARVALAVLAMQPAKFGDFYLALAATTGDIDGVKALNVVRSEGLDHYKVFRAANQPDITDILTQGVGLAAALRVLDTPAYVIGADVVSGYADLARKRTLIATAR
ncbi:hypothetical protein LJE71_00220 [Xanthobacter autotrophicus]|uniref:DsbA family protein n=1 Tax=Xanthobacter autotrophicus TaxID=280 RepID=UPI001E3522E3|nr:DsbA family protein [Xanthobacter autotrophicus]UDQ89496.1 hypothetical protein LJE71_00220 [Xanthobacter autotrophicus]